MSRPTVCRVRALGRAARAGSLAASLGIALAAGPAFGHESPTAAEAVAAEPELEPGDPDQPADGDLADPTGSADETGPTSGRAERPPPGPSAAEGPRREAPELDEPTSALPARMRPLQAAGWWTLFGAAALATTGGVFSGLAEREQDRATRLARTFDPATGAALRYEDVQDRYEQTVRRGERFQVAAISTLVAGSAGLVAAVTLFVVDARRAQKGHDRAERRARLGAAGIEVRF